MGFIKLSDNFCICLQSDNFCICLQFFLHKQLKRNTHISFLYAVASRKPNRWGPAHAFTWQTGNQQPWYNEVIYRVWWSLRALAWDDCGQEHLPLLWAVTFLPAWRLRLSFFLSLPSLFVILSVGRESCSFKDHKRRITEPSKAVVSFPFLSFPFLFSFLNAPLRVRNVLFITTYKHHCRVSFIK